VSLEQLLGVAAVLLSSAAVLLAAGGGATLWARAVTRTLREVALFLRERDAAALDRARAAKRPIGY
jgi:hypothetical protein